MSCNGMGCSRISKESEQRKHKIQRFLQNVNAQDEITERPPPPSYGRESSSSSHASASHISDRDHICESSQTKKSVNAPTKTRSGHGQAPSDIRYNDKRFGSAPRPTRASLKTPAVVSSESSKLVTTSKVKAKESYAGDCSAPNGPTGTAVVSPRGSDLTPRQNIPRPASAPRRPVQLDKAPPSCSPREAPPPAYTSRQDVDGVREGVGVGHMQMSLVDFNRRKADERRQKMREMEVAAKERVMARRVELDEHQKYVDMLRHCNGFIVYDNLLQNGIMQERKNRK